MPTYQYSCTECGHFFEQFQSFTDDSLTDCPAVPGRLRKVFNAVGVVFKGSGFYRTDSRATTGAQRRPRAGGTAGARRRAAAPGAARHGEHHAASSAATRHSSRLAPAGSPSSEHATAPALSPPGDPRRHNAGCVPPRADPSPPTVGRPAVRWRDRPALVRLVDVRRAAWSLLLVGRAAVVGVTRCAGPFPQTTGTLTVPGSTPRSRCCATTPASRRSTPTPPTTCSSRRASCRPRTGSTRWTSAATSPRAGCRRCSATTPSTSTRSCARWGGGGSPSRSWPARRRRHGLPRVVQRRRQRLPRTTTRRARSRWSTRCSRVGGLDYRVEDWTPADSVAWLKAMAWDLRGNMQDEIDRAMASTRT